MSRLTPAERLGVNAVTAAAATYPPELAAAHRRNATALADHLRRNLPDLGDVTIARVLLHLGGYLGRQVTSREGHILVDGIMFTALELTELERGDHGPLGSTRG